MRVTVDIDNDSVSKMLFCLVKGIILCRRLPYKIRKTEKGWHLIWKGLNIDEEKSMEYRRILGDDPNRIKLDKNSTRIKQVLFTEKQVFYYGGIFPKWIKNKGWEAVKVCPKCGKEVKFSEKRWMKDEKALIIYHTDETKCSLPLRRNFSL